MTAVWAFLYQASIGAVGYALASEIPSARLRPATIGIAGPVGQLCALGMGFATPYVRPHRIQGLTTS